MVTNSFFKDWPDTRLEFPLITIKEGESKGEISEEISSPILDHSNSILQGDEEDEDNDETKEESDTEEGELTE